MSELAGKTNMYKCKCGHRVTTVNRNSGTTPFMIGHIEVERDTQCQKGMESSFYRVPADAPPVTHEWFTPNREEYETLEGWFKEHVDNGGLLLRERP